MFGLATRPVSPIAGMPPPYPRWVAALFLSCLLLAFPVPGAAQGIAAIVTKIQQLELQMDQLERTRQRDLSRLSDEVAELKSNSDGAPSEEGTDEIEGRLARFETELQQLRVAVEGNRSQELTDSLSTVLGSLVDRIELFMAGAPPQAPNGHEEAGQAVTPQQTSASLITPAADPPEQLPTQEEGVTLEVAYTSDYLANVAGGVKRGATYLDNIDITVGLDLDRLVGWKGATAFVYALANQGGSPSELVGDLQTLSNLDSPDAWKIYEAWVEQEVLDGRISIKTGLYDLNSEFDVIESAGLFLNSSHGIGPDFSQTGENGPSIFPTTSLGIRISVRPTENVQFQLVALDGVSGDPDNPNGTHVILRREDGVLMVGEIAINPWGHGKLTLGGFSYTTKSDPMNVTSHDGNPVAPISNRGFYVIVDQPIFSEPGYPDQGLSAFARFGRADPRVNQIRTYLGAGLTYTGIFSGRDVDQVGIAVAHARNCQEFLEAQAAQGTSMKRAETAIEISYAAQVREWLSIQPDLQYIINPGTERSLGNALVVGLRVGLAF